MYDLYPKAAPTMKGTLSVLLLVLFFSPCLASAFTGKVVGVADGDTVTVLAEGNRTIKVRLYGIDCPEKAQDFGTKAKQFTSAMVFGKKVDVEPIDQDRYGRTVGLVTVDRVNVNEAILKAGLAWVYTTYCRKAFCPDWQAIQGAVQKARIGLWSHPDPISPWSYRRGQRTGQEGARPQAKDAGSYHGNTSSHVFHKPGCRYYDCKNCTRIFQTREEAIKAGYRPCGNCNP